MNRVLVLCVLVVTFSGCVGHRSRKPLQDPESRGDLAQAAPLRTPRLLWDYPPELLPLVRFKVWATPDLAQPFAVLAVVETNEFAQADWQDTKFFRVSAEWKD